MLCINKYTKKYVGDIQKKINMQVSSYKETAAAAGKQNGKTLNLVLESFEHVFFNNMVIVLESYFVHRSRAIEGKDGNPLNEVRLLCNSMMNNDNIFTADKTIKFIPEKSILKYKSGDKINLSEKDFGLLSKSFFEEIEKKFV